MPRFKATLLFYAKWANAQLKLVVQTKLGHQKFSPRKTKLMTNLLFSLSDARSSLLLLLRLSDGLPFLRTLLSFVAFERGREVGFFCASHFQVRQTLNVEFNYNKTPFSRFFTFFLFFTKSFEATFLPWNFPIRRFWSQYNQFLFVDEKEASATLALLAHKRS